MIGEETEGSLLRDLNEALDQGRYSLGEGLVAWFQSDVRKKAAPDLDAKVTAFGVRLRDLAAKAKFEVRDGAIVLVADRLGEDVLRELRFGTMWFVGTPDIESVVTASVK